MRFTKCVAIANQSIKVLGYTSAIHLPYKVMLVKVQKWGNSQGIRLSKEVLSEANILIGDALEITTTKEHIIIKPVRKIRGKYQLQDLIAQIPPDYQVQEEDWGSPVGLEVW